MNKDERSIIKQLTKRGIIGDLSDRDFDIYAKFVSYDKGLGLVKVLYTCDYMIDDRYMFYDDQTFEKVASINVEWDDMPRFDNPDVPAGWDAYVNPDYIFASELTNVLTKSKGVC